MIGLISAVFVVLTIGSALAGTSGAWVGALLLGGLTVVVVSYFITMLRLAPGVVVVTVTGIYHRSLSWEHFVPWTEVYGVDVRNGETPWITVRALSGPGTRQRNHGRLFGTKIEHFPFMVVRASWLGGNAVPAYQCIKYYFDHPDQRMKLTVPDGRPR